MRLRLGAAGVAFAVLGAAALYRAPVVLRAAQLPMPRVGVGPIAAAIPVPTAPTATATAPRRARPTRAPTIDDYRAEALDPVYEPTLSWFHDCTSIDECSMCPPCDPGETCGMDRALGRRACVASDCSSDKDCSSGWHCRQISAEVHRCIESGDRPLGGGCDVDPDWRRLSCAEGLACSAGRCVAE